MSWGYDRSELDGGVSITSIASMVAAGSASGSSTPHLWARIASAARRHAVEIPGLSEATAAVRAVCTTESNSRKKEYLLQ